MNRSALMFAGLGIAALAGLLILLKPAEPPVTTAATIAKAPEPVAAAAAALEPKAFELVIRNGQRVSGPVVIQVRAGDDVTIRLTSDQADELHLHGYDLHVHLHAGEPATLRFKAVHSGRFDYELHRSHLELGTLEVLP